MIGREESFESLRQTFRSRLRGEGMHFDAMRAAIFGAHEDRQKMFEDLIYRAHRLQGGAAIFGEADVAMAARRLEGAAAAARSGAANCDEDLRCALEALVTLIGRIETSRSAAQAEHATV